MPSPYPILETLMSKGYTIELSMGDDRWFYITASHPQKADVMSTGNTIANAVILLDSRLKECEAA